MERALVVDRCDRSLLEHQTEHGRATCARDARMRHGVVQARILRNAGEERGLRQRELLRVVPEVRSRRALDAVRTIPEVDRGEIGGEDLALGPALLELPRERRL